MTLCVTDLDGTLVFTGNPAPELRLVETFRSGRTSLIHEPAREILARLGRDENLLVATSRTVEQFLRADLPSLPYVLASNGLELIDHGKVSHRWREGVDRILTASTRPWSSLKASCQPVLAAAGVLEAVTETYFVVAVGTPDAVIACARGLTPILDPSGWSADAVGRKLYLLPTALDKKAGVARFMGSRGFSDYVAAGDSPLDLEMLLGANAAMAPRGSQLAGLTAQGLLITQAEGPSAGTEILTWFCSQLASGN